MAVVLTAAAAAAYNQMVACRPTTFGRTSSLVMRGLRDDMASFSDFKMGRGKRNYDSELDLYGRAPYDRVPYDDYDRRMQEYPELDEDFYDDSQRQIEQHQFEQHLFDQQQRHAHGVLPIREGTTPMQNGLRTLSPPHIEGLAALVEYLAPEMQDAALQWCLVSDTPSVQLLVLMEQDEAFIAALGVQPGGNADLLLRERLAAVRSLLGANSFDRRTLPPPPVHYNPSVPGRHGVMGGAHAPGDIGGAYGDGEVLADGLNHQNYQVPSTAY
jgi:hypothetical protein